ncbi:MAG: ParB/RepB/Spo0J family partition protein [Planctomycetes bacterium]|nr:ParB/RepB/Spo0J family partition protein [Planctomycetota bacterium]
MEQRQAGDEVLQAEVASLVVNPYQPRKEIHEAELAELAESIRASGILQPILARRVGDKLEIIAGERRWRAAQLAGLTKVPVLVRSVSDQDSAVFALVENLQREDLNAMEKAQGFKLLLTTLNTTQEGVAKKVGLDRTTVTNFLRLLDLPTEVQAHVSRGTLSMGHARCLLALGDNETITQVADESIKQAWSVRALEARVKEALEASKGQPAGTAGKSKARPVWLNELEESLVEALGTPVQIRYGRKRSQIIIDCGGREEFERVFQRLKNA